MRLKCPELLRYLHPVWYKPSHIILRKNPKYFSTYVAYQIERKNNLINISNPKLLGQIYKKGAHKIYVAISSMDCA